MRPLPALASPCSRRLLPLSRRAGQPDIAGHRSPVAQIAIEHLADLRFRRHQADTIDPGQRPDHRVHSGFRRLLELPPALFVDRSDLLLDQAQLFKGSLQLSQRRRRQRFATRRLQLGQLLPRLLQFDLEPPDAVQHEKRLHSVDQPRNLGRQSFPLAQRPFGVLLLDRRDRRHAAVLGLTPQPAQQGAQQKAKIEPIRLRPPVLARHRDARRVDHMDFNPLLAQPPRQPEAVSAGLIGNTDALDRMACLRRLVTPPLQLLQQIIRRRRCQRLPRLPLQPGSQAANQPFLAAHLDCRDKRAILIKGGEGTAEVIELRMRVLLSVWLRTRY